MGAGAGYGRNGGVEADSRREGSVPRCAVGGDQGDYGGREPYGGGDADRGG
jgi:hypothetical protein